MYMVLPVNVFELFDIVSLIELIDSVSVSEFG